MFENEKLIMHLYGRFRLLDQEGTDFAPKSAKAQALLALVATGDSGSRGRLWLQKKLWPNSESDRASVSLRQCL
ncbi:MAG: SARP family transcriptional regulator, partial [Boseongicola sp.]|nr:SARP family transcriptional regulator [Boseongicola sp.]